MLHSTELSVGGHRLMVVYNCLHISATSQLDHIKAMYHNVLPRQLV